MENLKLDVFEADELCVTQLAAASQIETPEQSQRIALLAVSGAIAIARPSVGA